MGERERNERLVRWKDMRMMNDNAEIDYLAIVVSPLERHIGITTHTININYSYLITTTKASFSHTWISQHRREFSG